MAKSNQKRRLETGMLSFARSLQPSEGLFWGTRKNDPELPIEVFEKGVRGQSSEFKTDNPGKSNPQVVEAAVVPMGCDGVRLDYSLRVLPHALEPWACGDKEVAQTYKDLVGEYVKKGGFDILARLYLWNIANARFAWRNRFQSDEMRVEIEFEGVKVNFDPTLLSLEQPASLEQLRDAVPANKAAPIKDLIASIAGGLKEQGRSRLLNIAWRAKMQEGQEVFPSQEYLREEKAKNAPSRVYAKLPHLWNRRFINQASMHSQKIGAAIRHIDVWHGHHDYKAIAVNPYGGVQETGAVLRVEARRGGEDSSLSFYALRSKSDDLFKAIANAKDADAIPGDVHFVVANLVRGGVFGQKGGDA